MRYVQSFTGLLCIIVSSVTFFPLALAFFYSFADKIISQVRNSFCFFEAAGRKPPPREPGLWCLDYFVKDWKLSPVFRRGHPSHTHTQHPHPYSTSVPWQRRMLTKTNGGGKKSEVEYTL